MEFREATAEDFDFVADHSISRGKRHPEQTDYVYTLEHDGQPLGIGGFKMMNYDTAWCWVDLTDIADSHTIVVYRVIKEWIESFAKEHNLKRLQATIECDFDKAITMVQHLGFKKESIMENYIDGKPAFLYRRLF